VLFFAVGVAELLVTVNTPLRFDEDIGAAGRAALNALSAFAVVFGLGVLVFPWRRFGRNAFAVVPVVAAALIALVIAFSGVSTASGTGSSCWSRSFTGCTSRCV
jgi:hypothetical protein